MVHALARAVITLDEEIARTDAAIEARFREHQHVETITSMPGIGRLLGAEFIAFTGGDTNAFGSSGQLAGVAGLAPVPKDSGRISGNMPAFGSDRCRTRPPVTCTPSRAAAGIPCPDAGRMTLGARVPSGGKPSEGTPGQRLPE